MGKSKNKKKYIQWYTRFTEEEDLIMHKLRKYLFEKEITDSKHKYTFIKYCCLNTLWDYADEIIDNFTYTEEELVELAEKHKKLSEKYTEMLGVITGVKEEKKTEVLKESAKSR